MKEVFTKRVSAIPEIAEKFKHISLNQCAEDIIVNCHLWAETLGHTLLYITFIPNDFIIVYNEKGS